jgi:hypothetical protein
MQYLYNNKTYLMKPRSILLFALVTLVYPSLNGQKEAWKSIFNGRDFSGWQVCANPEDAAKHYWKVQDSAIVANTNGDKNHNHVWLATIKEYQDFEIKLRFAMFKSAKGNSGVMIRSRWDKDSLYMDGPQVDINPPEPYRIGLMWDETRGSNRWIFPDLPKPKWVNKSMVIGDPQFLYSDDSLQWNQMDIKVKGWQVQAWVNGVFVTDFNNRDILSDQIHKVKKVGAKGVIAFQLHSRDDVKIMYRDIYIRKL